MRATWLDFKNPESWFDNWHLYFDWKGYGNNSRRVRLLLQGEDGVIIEEGAAFEQERAAAEFDLAFEIPRLFFNHRLDNDQFLLTKMYRLKNP